jgi:hypothetical protein
MTVPHYVIVGPSEEERAENLARARAACIAQELVTYEEIRDEFFSKEELTGMGWIEHPFSGNWAPASDKWTAECKRFSRLNLAESSAKAEILAILDALRAEVERGETISLVTIAIQTGRDFHVRSAGDVSMVQLAGYLGAAQLDALNALWK